MKYVTPLWNYISVLIKQRFKPIWNKLVFCAPFHHMNSDGYYTEWTNHYITVIPTFDGFDIAVSGSNKNDIKNYIADRFDIALL